MASRCFQRAMPFFTNGMKRIVADIILFLSLLLFPWWVSLLLGLFLAFQFRNFYEIILAGLSLDLLFDGSAGGFHFFFLVLFFGAFLVSFLVKEKLIFYTEYRR